jgi:hypothetical protein
MARPTTAVALSLLDALSAARNADGGWGYYPGKASRLEPTAWVALAGGVLSEGARAWLGRAQSADGWLRDDPRAPVNFGFNGLGLLALLTGGGAPGNALALCKGLLGAKGLAFGPSPVVRQDNSLQAWPWVDGTLSWVEPTAYCLLGLKRARSLGVIRDADARTRIEVGERMLADRACPGGGWNYGNAEVFDKKLYAHGPTTALALLALQDRRDLAEVGAGLEFLAAHAESEPSGLALALTSICLDAYGRSLSRLAAAARARAMGSIEMGNTVTLAALLLALGDEPVPVRPFVL